MADDPAPSRRQLLLSAGLSLAAASAPAETARATAQGEVAAAVPFAVDEYWAKKGEVSLSLYRKRLDPRASARGGAPPVLFLVHGSSISARPSFDLTVPGAGEYSLMNVFARQGFDVWTMDCEGYGRSSRTEGNSDIKSGVADLAAGTEVVIRETGREKFHFLGESSGALRAAAFAAARPERVDRLVLEAFTWTGAGSPTLAKRSERLDYYRSHNRRPRDRDMIRSIFTRDKPGTSDPRVAEALADAELPFGDTIPTGTYLDMTANLPVVDPTKVLAPLLLLRGEYDGIATLDDLQGFFGKLPNPDRQFVMLAGAAHALNLGVNRAQVWHVVQAFLGMPPRVDA
jgi:pimeloyl-ACP methyl ester carboxylesterase